MREAVVKMILVERLNEPTVVILFYFLLFLNFS
jgi:hypothetical protein